jgi:hypothetical protein
MFPLISPSTSAEIFKRRFSFQRGFFHFAHRFFDERLLNEQEKPAYRAPRQTLDEPTGDKTRNRLEKLFR